jgi:uncharacterized Zn-finger protein
MIQKTACIQKIYEVTYKDTPLSCPMPGMRLSDAHPRVYLPIEVTGEADCEYCGAKYMLTDFSAVHGH